MKRLLLLLALLLAPATASAQCTGVFPAGDVCGTANGGTPHAVPFTTFVSNLALTQYHFFIGNASNKAVDTALAGDCVYGALGIICTKTNGVAFGTFATQSAPTGVANNCLQADTSGVVTGSNVPCGGFSFTTVTKTTTYAVQTSDCNTSFSLEGNAQYAVTVGAASGFAANCTIQFTNNDSAIGSGGHGKVMTINGVTLPIDFLYPGMTFQIQNIHNVWAILGLPPRLKITSAITVFVDTGGSDSNDGLTSGNAKLTIEAALLQGISNFDLNGVGAAFVVQVAAGTYTSTGDMVHYSGRNVGAQGGCAITVQGATGLALDIRLVATGGDVFSINTGAIICLRDLSVSTITSGNGITSDANSKVYVRNLSFYAVAGDHMLASNNSSIEFQSGYFIRGSAGGAHVHAANGGYINNNGFGGEFSSLSSASFTYFALATSGKLDYSGTITLSAVTVTGQRFLSQQNGTINTGTGDVNYFPGSIPGQGTNAGTSPFGLYQ